MFCGDENYKCTNTMSSITIIPSIITSDLIKTYKNDSQFDSEFYDVNGELLANQEIQFNINGVNYSRTTNENGIARMNINLNPGNYSITSINPFTNESIANTICVLPTITDNDDLVKYYRNNSQFCVKVTNLDGSLAKDGEVIFNINGVFYQRQVNSSGIAKLNINLNPGEYIITSEYNGCKVSNLITVLPFLVADDMVKEYKTVDQFKIKVLDATGNSLANAQVTFNINGVFYNRTSDLEGIAALNINLIPGKYIITSFYNSLYVSNYIEVLKTLSVGENLTNAQIQQIIDNADGKVAIRFEGNKYDDISLNINHPLLITGDNTELNGKLNSQVISVNSDDVIVKNININANNASGIILNDVANVEIMNNVISNINKFSGNGISILGSQVSIVNNTIKNFNYAIYSNSTSENIILNNRFVENNNTIFISSQNQEYNITNNTVCIPCLFNCTDGVCQFVFDEGACVPCLLNCTDGVCQFVFDEG
ncbi:MAG: adhesin, partial [Methanobrevibacter sp.]|nr:adhesin [Methanobrevibacter sp.]